MTLTTAILLVFFLGTALSIVLILVIVLAYLERQKWMRVFSEKQGIPVDIMEGRAEKPAQPGAAVPHKKEGRRFPVPIPGADWMRKQPDQ